MYRFSTIILLFTLLALCFFVNVVEARKTVYKIPVVVIKYYPVKGENIDIAITGDWGKSLDFTRAKVDSITKRIVETLEEGSRYHAYKNTDAEPSLKYNIIKEYEFIEPMPTYKKDMFSRTPMTDYNEIMLRIDIEKWVKEKGVKEIWIWGYHGGVLDLWESNMSGPFGDISNSDRDENDLPKFDKTYTVYHYNYQRGLSEATENHMHQIEAVINFVDGRDDTPGEQWENLLFWGKFVGSDISHKIIKPGCGWSHYPPNGEKDYDWANKKYVWTDIEDWKPDGRGTKQKMNCERWDCQSLSWFVYWMQSLPGKNNGLKYKGKLLTNWWIFIGDFDRVMNEKMKLIEY